MENKIIEGLKKHWKPLMAIFIINILRLWQGNGIWSWISFICFWVAVLIFMDFRDWIGLNKRRF